MEVKRLARHSDGVRCTLIGPDTSQSNLTGDIVYFHKNNSPDSYSIYLDRDDAMSDDAVLQFIQSKDVTLFKRLFQRAAVPLPADFSKQASSHSSYLKPRRRKPKGSSKSFNQSAKPKILSVPAEQVRMETCASRDCFDHQDTIILQLKSDIISALLTYHLFILRRASGTDETLRCANPFCNRHTFSIPARTYFFTLQTCSAQAVNPLTDSIEVANFCLDCLETMFDRTRAASVEELSLSPMMPATIATSLDGACDTKTILEAAERLAARAITPPAEMILDRGSMPFNYPSNSPQALFLRKQRDDEIKEILEYIKRYESHGESMEDENEDNKSPTLIVFTRSDVEPSHERYKKQGLTAYDKWGKNRGERTASAEERKKKEEGVARAAEMQAAELHCYCRKPIDGQDMVRCSSEYCVVGLVHFKCSNLLRLPIVDETWYCSYCSDTFESSVSDPLVEISESDLHSDQEEDFEEENNAEEHDCEVEEGKGSRERDDDDDTEENTEERDYKADKEIITEGLDEDAEDRTETNKEDDQLEKHAKFNEPQMDGLSGTSTLVEETTESAAGGSHFRPGAPNDDHSLVNSRKRTFFTCLDGAADYNPSSIQSLKHTSSSFSSLDGLRASPMFKFNVLGVAIPSTSASFSDLAPFIFIDLNLTALSTTSYSNSGLTQQHLTALNQWKALCPASRLLYPPQTQTGSEYNGMEKGKEYPGFAPVSKFTFTPAPQTRTASATDKQNAGIGVKSQIQTPAVVKLSTVLADVDRQAEFR